MGDAADDAERRALQEVEEEGPPASTYLMPDRRGRRPDDHLLPDAGDWDDEDLYNFDTDGYDRRKLHVECPHCKREASPLCSPNTSIIEAGWRWVGLDHKEPYATYRALCAGCKGGYRFTTHTPQ